MKYLALLSDPSNIGKYSLDIYDLAQYMRLDASAVKALNIMPSAQDGIYVWTLGFVTFVNFHWIGSNKTMSLYGLLNLCKTSQGSRILAQWLKQPLMNISEIGRLDSTWSLILAVHFGNLEKRQDIVETFVHENLLRHDVRVFVQLFLIYFRMLTGV
jgi:DNA mismatch repair ATPase MutS